MDIVVGTYEQLLLGYRVTKNEAGEAYQISQSFTDNNHMGCIKTLAISGNGVLASGSSDEIIQLLNLKKRVEMGSLIQHSGAVTELTFHQSSHLFSVSEDACVCIWKYRTWECLRTLKGHKDAITSVSVHPSGKLALTVSKDHTLRTWNLVTGRQAYISNTPHVAEFVRWSPKGDYYAIKYDRLIHIYDTATATVHCKLESKVAVNAMVFCQDTVMAYSIEGGTIHIHDIKADKPLHVIYNETKRVKCLVCEKCPDNPDIPWLVTGSSNGDIKIYQLNLDDLSLSFLVAEVSSGFRIVCMAALSQELEVKPQEEDESSDEEGEVSDDYDWSEDSGDEVIVIDRKQNDAQKKRRKKSITSLEDGWTKTEGAPKQRKKRTPTRRAKGAPKDTVKGTLEQRAKGAQKDTTKGTPKHQAKGSPKDTLKETPTPQVKGTPKDTVKGTPKSTTKIKTSKDTIKKNYQKIEKLTPEIRAKNNLKRKSSLNVNSTKTNHSKKSPKLDRKIRATTKFVVTESTTVK